MQRAVLAYAATAAWGTAAAQTPIVAVLPDVDVVGAALLPGMGTPIEILAWQREQR
jgi:hypothetical protein